MPEVALATETGILDAFCRGEIPIGVALMRLAAATRHPAEFAEAVAATLERQSVDASVTRRLEELRDVVLARPDMWHVVRSVLAEAETLHGDGVTAINACAAAFDRAVARSEEASVALYSLGDRALLDAATAEIAALMRDWGLLGCERHLLDIGCGIGRLEVPLAGEVRRIIATDISAAMAAIARRRCADLANVEIRHCSGTDLAGIGDATLECVFTVDSFPYIVGAGTDLAEVHFREAARVLRPAGDLLILNYSYRGDAAVDREDVLRLGTAHGFEPRRLGDQPFRLWDGRTFHLTRRT